MTEVASASSHVIVLCQLCNSRGLEFSLLIKEVLCGSFNSGGKREFQRNAFFALFHTLMLVCCGPNLISETANHRCSYHTAWIGR